MMKINSFNIRVYGLCILNNQLLVLKESYAGQKLIKLPGGGLEFGENILDCLHREFLEELNLKIKIKRHFYTQETLQVSRFKANEQLLCLYYLVEILNLDELKILDDGIDEAIWLDLAKDKHLLKLPIDAIVMEML